ncbi:MAG: CAAX prenyl protease-related protein [Betaproteobacteria bacterium]|nr:CAAX prenyl protease-related protein [Betaproteobacteria bacterium]
MSSPETRATLARVVPFAIYIAFLVLNTVLPGDVIDTRWLYPVRVGVVAVALAWFWRDYDELKGRFSMPGGLWALSAIVGLIVFVLWVNLSASWMVLKAPAGGFDPRDGGQINHFLAVSRVAGAALVVPLMEELFWRSFLMRWVDNPRFRSVLPTAITAKALIVSSVIFGVEHNEWFAGILAGVAYGGLYRLTGNLWAPVVAHGLTNALLGMFVLYTGSWHFW